ncbi:MAG: hypothetical protein JW896_11315 [Deltaproteobacteria bacterium]|nr:hypothetical protein [Deltaproteobacteria bacterium]
MQNKEQLQARFIDNPAIIETFADSIHAFSFDGQTMRIEFCATRLDEPKPQNPQTATRHPICRLVLTPTATLDLFNKLQKLVNALEQSGVLKRKPPPPATVQ